MSAVALMLRRFRCACARVALQPGFRTADPESGPAQKDVGKTWDTFEHERAPVKRKEPACTP